jgi:hypothetical protein
MEATSLQSRQRRQQAVAGDFVRTKPTSAVLRIDRSPPISVGAVGVVHRRVGLRRLLGTVFLFEREPRALEARLGLIDRLGVAKGRAGNGDGDVPEPDAWRALAGGADASDRLAVFKRDLVVRIDQAETEHQRKFSVSANDHVPLGEHH